MGIQNIEALIGDVIPCIVTVGHPSGTPAKWRDKNSMLTVCTRHKDQYDERQDLGPYDWERIEEG